MRTVRSLATVSTVEALEADLERRVLDGEFEPGEHLGELELARRYGVGRHTLRAAFDRLARRGLLQKAPNRGVFVPVLTPRDLAEIYEVRVALEAKAFEALASRRAVPEAALEAVARLRSLTEQSPWRLVVDADFAFHTAIVSAAGNRRLKRALDDLQAEILLWLVQLKPRYGSVQKIADEHVELVRTLESGQAEAAAHAIRIHLEQALVWLISTDRTSDEAAPGPHAGADTLPAALRAPPRAGSSAPPVEAGIRH